MPDEPRKPTFTPGTLLTAELLNDAFGKLWDAVDDLRREVEMLKAQPGAAGASTPRTAGPPGPARTRDRSAVRGPSDNRDSVCAVPRRGSPVGASPTWLTQSLQPVAIGAAVEATKPSKPSRLTCRFATRRAGRP
jgi:hypothetical protein